jgi:hypothetical protein
VKRQQEESCDTRALHELVLRGNQPASDTAEDLMDRECIVCKYNAETIGVGVISSKRTYMDRITTMGGGIARSGGNPNAATAKIEGAAQVAREATDKPANKATAQVDRMSGTAHRAVTSAADAASGYSSATSCA